MDRINNIIDAGGGSLTRIILGRWWWQQVAMELPDTLSGGTNVDDGQPTLFGLNLTISEDPYEIDVE